MAERLKISVVLPYNVDRGYLSEAIESYNKQTLPESQRELIIEHGNYPVAININNALQRVTGDLIRWLGEDDLLPKESLEESVNYFECNPDVEFAHANSIDFNEVNNKPYTPRCQYPDLKELLEFNHIHGGTVVYRKKCFEKRNFDISLWCGEEWEFHLWLLANGYALGYHNFTNFFYREHKLQKSIGNRDREYQLTRAAEFEKIKQRYTVPDCPECGKNTNVVKAERYYCLICCKFF
jgi:glycosyltransferase involved in cell wall biosynthesis